MDEIRASAEHQKSKIVWETVNEFTGRKETNNGRIKGKSTEERIKKWKDHFLNLLGQPPVTRPNNKKIVLQHTLQINTDNFTMEELNKCIKCFKNTKASGLHNIPIEVWKMGALNLRHLEVCSKELNGGRVKIWVKSGIIPLPKKGDLGDTGNYRGISLTVVAANIYNKLLLERKRSHLDSLLWINQNGFRPGGSTTAQIVTLRRFTEGLKAKVTVSHNFW